MIKGVSPLVAAVLLIAVTMTIAAMLSYWASGFVRSRTEEWEKRLPAGECSFANFRVYSCKYDTGTITMVLENVKDVDLRNITAYVLNSDSSIDVKTGLSDLPALQIKSYSLTGISASYEKITIKTHCPDVIVTDDCR